jgi:aspartyl-tRNA(Asn)/glutamyl-tRNA(Gln) amidotransferase subunit A
VDRALTLAQAAEADARIAAGTATPLTGVPIAHKDIFVTKGWRTTAGSKMLANYVSPFDATVVEKVPGGRHGHAGQAQLRRIRHGLGNENSAFGAVKNPWDKPPCRAARRAARPPPWPRAWRRPPPAPTPAARSASRPLCGITGIKPTYGRVSRFGMIAFASSLDQGGPMAADRRRLRAAAERHGRLRRARFDQPDAGTGRRDEDFTRELGQPLTGLRIGVPKSTSAKAWPPTWKRPCAPRWRSMKSWAPPWSTSRCRIPSCRFPPTT